MFCLGSLVLNHHVFFVYYHITEVHFSNKSKAFKRGDKTKCNKINLSCLPVPPLTLSAGSLASLWAIWLSVRRSRGGRLPLGMPWTGITTVILFPVGAWRREWIYATTKKSLVNPSSIRFLWIINWNKSKLIKQNYLWDDAVVSGVHLSYFPDWCDQTSHLSVSAHFSHCAPTGCCCCHGCGCSLFHLTDKAKLLSMTPTDITSAFIIDWSTNSVL